VRTHGTFSTFDLRLDIGAAKKLLSPDALVAARLEPTLSVRYEGLLDLTFERDGGFLTVPLVKVEAPMLVARESDPLIWPRWVRDLLDGDVADRIQELIFPWLRARVLARFENDESIHVFAESDATRSDFERDRSLGLLGAAPFSDVVRSAAAAMYARRFTRGRSVGVYDPSGGNGAAFLVGRAASVYFDSGNADRNAFVRRWFSTLSFAPSQATAADIAVGLRERLPDGAERVIRGAALANEHPVIVARPLPLSVMLSFDPEDSVADESFAVAVRSQAAERSSTLREPAAVGGSSGNVAIVVREDVWSNPDADTDAVRMLVRRLEAEGFTPSVSIASRPLHSEAIDIVHVVGHRHASAIRANLQSLKERGIPIVVMPYLDDPGGVAAWGASTSLGALRSSPDDAFYEEYLGAIATKRLVWEVPVPVAAPPPDPDVRALFELASSIVVVSEEEEQRARAGFGYRGPAVHVPALFDTAEPASVDALVGHDDFVLVHTSIEPRSGVVFAALAASKAGFATVVTGPIGNSEYYTYLQMLADDRVIFLPERSLEAGQLAGLYGRARVFLDASWSGHGLHRLARAAAGGAALVASSTSLASSVFGASVELVDPAGIDAIGEGLRRAWEAAPVRGETLANEAARTFDQQLALVGVVRAYQQASSGQASSGQASSGQASSGQASSGAIPS